MLFTFCPLVNDFEISIFYLNHKYLLAENYDPKKILCLIY